MKNTILAITIFSLTGYSAFSKPLPFFPFVTCMNIDKGLGFTHKIALLWDLKNQGFLISYLEFSANPRLHLGLLGSVMELPDGTIQFSSSSDHMATTELTLKNPTSQSPKGTFSYDQESVEMTCWEIGSGP